MEYDWPAPLKPLEQKGMAGHVFTVKLARLFGSPFPKQLAAAERKAA